jgi:hypothetical protein
MATGADKGIKRLVPEAGRRACGCWRKWAISVFVVVNLGTVLFMNRPVEGALRAFRVDGRLAPLQAYRIHLAEWFVMQYAHLVGLDNQWQMFGRQSRFNWSFRFKGTYANSPSLVLPLSLQSARSFWQRAFVDFREAKYQLNLDASETLRQAYARFLCREYRFVDGIPMRDVTIERDYQPLLTSSQAKRRHTHLEPQTYSDVIDVVPCPAFEQ